MLFLLAQQGMGSLALAAAEIFPTTGTTDVAAMAHDCASMAGQVESHSGTHAAASESTQHDHQDCIDAGCDDCVGCVACAVGYRNSLELYTSGRPVVITLTAAAPLPAPERLYRPPISS